MVAALVAVYLWLARPRPQASATPMASATLTDPRPTVSATPAAASSSVVVHVLGKVKHPGVVTLPSGSRVAEAIKAAGGVRSGAKTGTLNLARKLVDGEQIPVGIPAHSTANPGRVSWRIGIAGHTPDLNTATPTSWTTSPAWAPSSPSA